MADDIQALGVKEAFKEASEPEKWNRYMPVTAITSPVEFAIVNKKPIVASESELNINRRSHSAKLRILEKN